MSEYCKAYKLSQLQNFPDWKIKIENGGTNGKETERKSQTAEKYSGGDFLFLHDSYIVTEGIFEDKNIIFDNVTPAWKKFCKEQLKFEIPTFESVQPEMGTEEKSE